MTSTLETAIQKTAALSEDEQDWVGRLILDTLQDEQEWDRQFAASHEMLVSMADKALAEYRAGRTRELPG